MAGRIEGANCDAIRSQIPLALAFTSFLQISEKRIVMAHLIERAPWPLSGRCPDQGYIAGGDGSGFDHVRIRKGRAENSAK